MDGSLVAHVLLIARESRCLQLFPDPFCAHEQVHQIGHTWSLPILQAVCHVIP